MQGWYGTFTVLVYASSCSELICRNQEWKWRETHGGLHIIPGGDMMMKTAQDDTSGEGEKVTSLAYSCSWCQQDFGELETRWPSGVLVFEQTFVSFAEMGKTGEEIGLRVAQGYFWINY